MPDLSRACFFVARPVIAGMVHIVSGIRRTVRTRARQDVVHVGRVADTFNRFSFFGESGLLVEIVILPVQVCRILRDNLAFRVVPGSGADAFASMQDRHGIISGSRAQIRMPGLRTTDGFRQRLAQVVRARYAAKVSAVPRALAGNKETHRRASGTGGLSLPGLRNENHRAGETQRSYTKNE